MSQQDSGLPPPFEGSRRLTGPNLYFAGCGAVLETTSVPEASQLTEWRERVAWACAELGWSAGSVVARPHRGGAALAFEAPFDQLFCATEINEWAWTVACAQHVLHAPGHPSAWDRLPALVTLKAMAAAERDPTLRGLVTAARQQGLPVLWDDDEFSLGLGSGSRVWPRHSLPTVDAVDWSVLHDAPVAMVTGSNGKTSTVRLLAACCLEHGWDTGFNCTDGLFLNGELLKSSDYSGPAGARAVLRNRKVQAAVLEAARGGMLRRGLAYDRADAAIVTNISADHFGEYGIDDLEGLAQAKLSIARGLRPAGTLVLNADDAQLRGHAPVGSRLAWFALDFDASALREARAAGLATCGVSDGRLLLSGRSGNEDLGAVVDMPLTVGGAARYNIANLAGTALLADSLGIAAQTTARVFARFGAQRSDNPGRLQRWRLDGMEVLLDYAHNPDGLRGLLDAARALRGQGRLGLVLGQAGNRQDLDVQALAAVAATFKPDRIVLKDMDGYLRGRKPGEVPALLAEELLKQGTHHDALVTVLPEFEAACSLLDWGRSGDVLVMPIHALGARRAVSDLLDARSRNDVSSHLSGGPSEVH